MVCMILHTAFSPTCTAHSHALSNTLYIVLQEYGCLAIESLAFPENCLAVAKAGAVEVVVSAMNRHVKNTDVQYSGCLALQRLAHNDGAGASAADAGIDVDLILDGICSHSRRSPERALALKMLARDSAIEGTAKSSIAAAGGIDAILAAMRNHTCGSPEVQEQCCAALAALARNCAGDSTAIQDAGGVVAIEVVMRKHPSNSYVRVSTFGSLLIKLVHYYWGWTSTIK